MQQLAKYTAVAAILLLPAAATSDISHDLNSSRPTETADQQQATHLIDSANGSLNEPMLFFPFCEYQPTPPQPIYPLDDQIRLFSQEGFIDRSNVSHLQGDAQIHHNDLSIYADEIFYSERRGRVDAEGNVRIEVGGEMTITGPSGFLRLDELSGEFRDASFYLYERHARGQASLIEPRGVMQTRLTGANYTTCDPGRNDWLLSASRVDLDRESGRGVARNALFTFYRLPLLYMPYVDFPIDDRRKSGFLLPSFGNSNRTGYDFELPYYLNLAPQRDATISPRYMEKRGTMLRGEFRFLTFNSEGQIEADYLPDDAVFNDTRSRFAWDYAWNIDNRTRFYTFGSDVSDAAYFNDFAKSLEISSATHLEQRAEIVHSGSTWQLDARIQDYRTIDPNIRAVSRPYKRLPRLHARGRDSLFHDAISYDIEAEWVKFDRVESVTAQRSDIRWGLAAEVEEPGWFIRPKGHLRLTHYVLENTALDPFLDQFGTTRTRVLPTTSIDSGLIFDRLFSDAKLQTLEPRLYYTYTPFRDQENIPIFDTSERGFSLDQMFSDSRFSGADRVGDMNQLTTALTTRVVDLDSGLQQFLASIGQVHYFSNRRVGRNRSFEPETDTASSYIGEARWQPTRAIDLRLNLEWDKYWDEIESSRVRFRFSPDEERVINLAHRYRPESEEQIDISAAWPVTDRWTGFGGWRYNLRERELIETFSGLEYRSCCWAFRLLGRQTLTSNQDDPYITGVYAQLIFTGMGSFGDEIGSLLTNSIDGYESLD